MVTTSSSSNDTISLTGFTNAEKMIVLFDGSRYGNGNYDFSYYSPQVYSLTVDTLVVTSSRVRSNDFATYGYQVIELY